MAELTAADQLVPVTIFGREGCQQCKQSARKLDKHGVPYTYVDIEKEPTFATLVDAYAAQLPEGVRASLPLVVAGDVWWFGFRLERLSRLADIHHAAADIAPLDQAAQHYLEEAGA